VLTALAADAPLRPERLAFPSSVALDSGSVACLDDRRVVLLDRHGVRRSLLPMLANVMALQRGPDGALLLVEGNNLEGDAFKVYWTETREWTRVSPKVLGYGRSSDIGFVLVPESGERVVIHGEGRFVSLPWSALAALPRQSEAAFIAAHSKLEAKAAKKKR
jgi:hypothetical protein